MADVTIWKFVLPIEDAVSVEMPNAARVLAVGKDPASDALAVWVQITPSAPQVRRRFYIRGTGHPLREAVAYIGTVIDAPFVWHVFDGGYER